MTRSTALSYYSQTFSSPTTTYSAESASNVFLWMSLTFLCFPLTFGLFCALKKKLRSCLCVHDAHRISIENCMAHNFVGHFPQNVNFVANSSGQPPDPQRTSILLADCKSMRRSTYCNERTNSKLLHAGCVDQC